MSITAPELRRILQQTTVEDLPDLTETLTRDLVCAEGAAAAMSVAEVAELVGVSAHTLRYYERIGLVEVERDASGYRSYDRAAVGRVIFITRLRLSDMPVRDIAHYIELVGQGAETVPARLALLEKHRAQIRHQISALQLSLAVIDYKITTYGGRCRG